MLQILAKSAGIDTDIGFFRLPCGRPHWTPLVIETTSAKAAIQLRAAFKSAGFQAAFKVTLLHVPTMNYTSDEFVQKPNGYSSEDLALRHLLSHSIRRPLAHRGSVLR